MNWYIVLIADYPSAPEILFSGNTIGCARKNKAETKMLVRCKNHIKGKGCLSWVTGTESVKTTEEIKIEIKEAEWLVTE